MFEVYVIDTFPSSSNSFQCCRDENWTFRKIATCQSEEDAKELVRSKSRVFTDLPLFLADLHTPEEKKLFIDEFCFHNDMYVSYRRVFVGKPSRKTLTHALQAKGVTVTNHNPSTHQFQTESTKSTKCFNH